jgi:hypothetical protein
MQYYRTPETDKDTYILVIDDHSIIFEQRSSRNPYIKNYDILSFSEMQNKASTYLSYGYGWKH